MLKHKNISFLLSSDLLIKFPSSHGHSVNQLSSLVISSNHTPKKNPNGSPLGAFKILRDLTGQYPKILKAKTSVAAFSLRKGADIGVLVTLRKRNLWRWYQGPWLSGLGLTSHSAGPVFDTSGQFKIGASYNDLELVSPFFRHPTVYLGELGGLSFQYICRLSPHFSGTALRGGLLGSFIRSYYGLP